MSNQIQPLSSQNLQLPNADIDTIEDMQYVSARINELVSAFNGLNQSKGFEITSISFNSVSEKFDVTMLNRHTKH